MQSQTQPIEAQADTAKRSVKQKATQVVKDGAKWGFWYAIAQLALEVFKAVTHH